ncbi:phosphotransferase family enzyme [Kribbella steppae]|uniref:Phosphotransferase family enzyme n=1 Tax=Kribbella steppae TaxID=2512223 RepID=A0A4R2HTG4_9ACTN|nr:phosphotransferase [Kribbella steppae]TCO34437.1 phosphotransferase family enzyme [Kribbella steppae]
MRHLPDSPSLGFLRKEAKDLLAALRESNPEVSLAEAQRTLAVEYGLRDWAELKAEVERRMLEAPVVPDGLAEALATTFGLGRVIKEASPVSFTPMGRCWSITTDEGRWLAVTVYPWITADQAELGTRLRDAAVAAGVTAPTPVRSPEGRLIETVQEQNWRVHEWIEVGPSPVAPTPTAVARRVGEIFGTLHSLALPTDVPIHPYVMMRKSEAEWDELLGRARAAGKPWAEQLAATFPTIRDLDRIKADFDGAEFILCNQVINPENVRLSHNDQLVVTEWDFAGSLTPEFEVAWALTHWALRPAVNHAAVTAFRDGYVDTAGRWPDLTLSSFGTAVTGWLNWTYNSICESISPTDPDHANFAERESTDLLKHPMTPASLNQLLACASA